eukprot:1140240-Pelagomonas_calceolata.AAC.1
MSLGVKVRWLTYRQEVKQGSVRVVLHDDHGRVQAYSHEPVRQSPRQGKQLYTGEAVKYYCMTTMGGIKHTPMNL